MDSATKLNQVIVPVFVPTKNLLDLIAELPLELRRYIWILIGHGRAEKGSHWHYELQQNGDGAIRVAKEVNTFTVYPLGGNDLFPICDSPRFNKLKKETFIEAIKGVTFQCHILDSLRNFVRKVNETTCGITSLPDLRFEVRVYQGASDFAALNEWEELRKGHPHGLKQHAYDHLKRISDAARQLPPGGTLVLGLIRPWRDYRFLRHVTVPLREHFGNVEVRLATKNWDAIPNKQLHISLATAAITDQEYRPNHSESEVRVLLSHGCRGIWGPDR